MRMNALGSSGFVDLITKLAQDYCVLVNHSKIPNSLTYHIDVESEPRQIQRVARMAALKAFTHTPIKKVAFDTRRVNQETDRNPRENLQYWNRTDQFIDDEMQIKIDIFANLLQPLKELKECYGTQPEWHGSYTRVLYDAVYRILRVKEADLDIFRPQIAYLEQLIFARYRLDMDELAKISCEDFKKIILKKDENLLKRGAYLQATKDSRNDAFLIKNNDSTTQQNIVNAIFGNNFRRDGERTVERTITITIRDEVKD